MCQQKLHDSSRKKNIKIWPIRCHADLFYKFTRKRMILAVKMSKAYVTFVTATRLFLCTFHCFQSYYEQRMRGLSTYYSGYEMEFFVSWGDQESLLEPDLTGILSDKKEDYCGDYIFSERGKKKNSPKKSRRFFSSSPSASHHFLAKSASSANFLAGTPKWKSTKQKILSHGKVQL